MAETSSDRQRLVVGLSGASGTIYGIRLIETLARMGHEVHLLVSASTWKVMAAEQGIEGAGPGLPLTAWLNVTEQQAGEQIVTYNVRDIAAAPASGTFRSRGMVVIPASMKTIGALAHGYADNLLTRCADCFLKERRPLILVPRETPLSLIHLRNLTALSEAGAHILPAMPGFYHNPQSMDDLVDFMVMKVLEALSLEHPHEGMLWRGPRREAEAEE